MERGNKNKKRNFLIINGVVVILRKINFRKAKLRKVVKKKN
jgi:hypothetical protein